MPTGRNVDAPAPSFCLAAFRLWLVAGAATCLVSNAFSVTTPVGPLAAWLVAMPLACLFVLEPCRACFTFVKLVSPAYGSVRPQARRLAPISRSGSRLSPGWRQRRPLTFTRPEA